MGMNQDAIEEWTLAMQEAKTTTAAEDAKRHLEAIKRKGG